MDCVKINNEILIEAHLTQKFQQECQNWLAKIARRPERIEKYLREFTEYLRQNYPYNDDVDIEQDIRDQAQKVLEILTNN